MSELVVKTIINGSNFDYANNEFASIESVVAVGYNTANTTRDAANNGDIYEAQTIWLPPGMFYGDDRWNLNYLNQYVTDYHHFPFNSYLMAQSQDDSVVTSIIMPKSWDGGNVKVSFAWKHWSYNQAGVTGSDVLFAVQAIRTNRNESLYVDWGSAPIVTIYSTGSVANTLYIEETTENVIVSSAGYTAGNSFIHLKITRLGTNTMDNLLQTVDFLGASLIYNTTSVTI